MEFKVNRENSIKNKIDNLKNLAKEHNLKVVFRNKTTNAGDFTFFVYKAEGGKYIVGFDGYWKTWDKNLSFNKCYNYTVNFIENYKD